jgi:S1-C subfamily serine protease
VHAVEENGPAARAGIRRGDLIVSVGGQPVTTVEELATGLSADGDAGNTDLVVVRGVDELAIAVNFEETAPSGQASA